LPTLNPNPNWTKLPLFDHKGWKTVRFGDVVRMLKEQVDPVAEGVERYVAGEHMETENVHIRKWGNVGDGYLGPAFIRQFRKGQVLYGSRRTYLKKVAMAEWDGVTANTTFVLEAVEGKLLQELLPWLMLSERFTKHSIQESKGSTNPYINFPDIAKLEFALPPLDQQRRIAEILWAVDETLSQYEATLEAARSALRTECENCFSQKGKTIWPKLLMEEVCTIQQGQVDPKQHPYSGMIHVAPDDIEGETGRILEKKTAAEDRVISGKYEFTPDAVLYCKIRPYLKKVALPRFPGICSADMYPLYPKPNILPEVLFRLLLSEDFTKYAIMHSARSAFPKLNREALSAYQFRLPPLDEQARFLLRVNAISSTADQIRAHNGSLNHLREALTNTTFA
jgi:type I restriction enzyme S subunit